MSEPQKIWMRYRVKADGTLADGLPTDNVRVVAEPLCQLPGNLAGHFSILGIRPVELLPVTMLIFAAIVERAQDIGIFLRQPAGGAAGGAPMTVTI